MKSAEFTAGAVSAGMAVGTGVVGCGEGAEGAVLLFGVGFGVGSGNCAARDATKNNRQETTAGHFIFECIYRSRWPSASRRSGSIPATASAGSQGDEVSSFSFFFARSEPRGCMLVEILSTAAGHVKSRQQTLFERHSRRDGLSRADRHLQLSPALPIVTALSE